MAGKIIKQNEYEEKADLADQLGKNREAALPDLSTHGAVISKESFAARSQVQTILLEAQSEARRIKDEARRLYERIAEKMQQEMERGFREGEQQGKAEATQLLIAAKRAKEKMFADLESQMIKLVFDVVEKILGRELIEHPGGPTDLIKQVLQAAIGQEIIVHVHPDDFLKIKEKQAELSQAIEGTKVLRLKEDDKVKPGGCIVETEIGTIDAQIETQLAAFKKAFEVA